MKKLTVGMLGALATVFVAGGAGAAELRVGLALEPSSIDPHYHNLSPNNAFARHIFDRLVQTDDTQQTGPGLAVSWKPLDDTTWEFKLRQGVTWHDGSPFTADDVLFTYERAPNVESSPSSFGTYTKGKTLNPSGRVELQLDNGRKVLEIRQPPRLAPP